MFKSLLDLIYPSTCCSCNRRLLKHEEALCGSCRLQLSFTDFENQENNLMENLLRPYASGLKASATCFFSESSPIQDLMHALKYNHRTDAGRLLGELMATKLEESARFIEYTAVVSVPLHHSKLFKRGYNQSEIVAKALSTKLGLEYMPHGLKRVKKTSTQTKLNREERTSNIQGAFEAGRLKDHKRIVLIDDVLTTGSTALECVSELKKAGVEQIWVATAAIAANF